MKNNAFWYGYLEAGEKGSLVVRAPDLDTGKPDTFYLYKQKRDAILEYKASFVEPKLRELNDKEQKQIPSLEKAYKKSLSQFQSRTSSPLNDEAAPSAKTTKTKNIADDLSLDDADEDFALDEAENEL